MNIRNQILNDSVNYIRAYMPDVTITNIMQDPLYTEELKLYLKTNISTLERCTHYYGKTISSSAWYIELNKLNAEIHGKYY